MSGAQTQDDYGYFGPEYSFADNVPFPSDVGVTHGASVGDIISSVAGVNFYVDTIAFGSQSFFDTQDIRPMGIRYFLDSGMRCSNGASMSVYFDGVTKGNLLGANVEQALEKANLPGLKGLAPGMLENARDALDPRPIFAAVTGTGYPVCQQVQCPVGDSFGSITNKNDPSAPPYIMGDVQRDGNNMPVQRRWVQAYDSTGSQIQITKDEFTASPKCYNPDGSYQTTPPTGCAATEPTRQSAGGQSPYELCTVIQPAVMPPSLETFTSADSEADMIINVGVALCIAVLGGIGLWSVSRRP